MALLIAALVVAIAAAATSIILMITAGPPFAASRGFSSVGEQIYFTGTDPDGAVSFARGPPWFQMHDGGCVVCHGSDGKGGRVSMMGTFTVPDIRYKTLTKPHEDMPAFTEETIKRAIMQGKDSDGSELSANMPRWRMSNEDLDSVIDFLKRLSQ
mgnify:FL=1